MPAGALLPLLAMLMLVTAVAALTFGATRYRSAAEPALIVLAAASLDRVGRSLGGSVEEGRRPGVHARA